MKYTSQKEYWVDPLTGEHRNDFDEMYRDIDDPWGCRQGVRFLKRSSVLRINLFFQKGV